MSDPTSGPLTAIRRLAVAHAAVAPLVFASLLPLSGPLAAAEPDLPVQYRDAAYAVELVSPGEAWIVGDWGLVLHGTGLEGGEPRWTRLDLGTREAFTGVAFAGRQNGWIVGARGTIYATGDGGETWQARESGVEEDLLAVAFADPSRGLAVGLFATVVETRDGGRTWTPRELLRGSVAEEDWEGLETQVFESPTLNDVFFVDELHGWIVGEFGVVLATRDGGESWERQPTGEQTVLFSVAFRDPEVGVAVGLGGLILATDDGGRSWEATPSGTGEALYHVALAGERGIAVGDVGTLLRSDDGGASWRPANPGITTYAWLRDVATAGGRSFLAVGAHATTLLSTDGGAGWTKLP